MVRGRAGAMAAACIVLATGAAAQKPYTGPETEGDAALFGSWSFEVTSLARGESGIGPVTNSVSACLKLGAKPADLPLMAQPLQGRCAMQRLELKAAYVSMVMLCEDFERRTLLMLHLEPRKDGAYAGRYSYTMTLDDDGSGTMSADADVVARRTGGC